MSTFNAFHAEMSVLMWESVVFWFRTVLCLRKQGEVRHLASEVQKLSKSVSRFSEVVAKTLLPCFYVFTDQRVYTSQRVTWRRGLAAEWQESMTEAPAQIRNSYEPTPTTTHTRLQRLMPAFYWHSLYTSASLYGYATFYFGVKR